MKKGLSIIAFLIYLCCIGCNHDEFSHDSAETIDCNMKDAKIVKELSSICDSVSFITLETNNDFLIGNVDKLIGNNDYIYILSNNRVYVYNYYGDAQYMIKRFGHARNEFTEISDFCVFQDNVILTDVQNKKILFFDSQGNIKNSIITDFFPERIMMVNDSTMAISCSGDSGPRLVVYNVNHANVINEYFPNEVRFSTPIAQTFVAIDDNVLYKQPLSNDFYLISSQGKVSKKYSFDFVGDNIQKEDLKEVNFMGVKLLADTKGNASISCISQYNDILCVRFECAKKLEDGYFYMLIDNEGHKALLSSDSFVDDMTFYDERLLPDIEQSCNKGFMGVIYPESWKSCLKKMPKERRQSKLFMNVNEYICENVNNNGNPIICIFHMKSPNNVKKNE